MSAWAISRVPLRSAGLSGSAGSAARRSHSTRSALCAFAGESTDSIVDASSQMPQVQAAKKAPDCFILTMALRSIFLASNHINAPDLGLQAQGWPPRGTLAPGAQSLPALPGKEFWKGCEAVHARFRGGALNRPRNENAL